MNRKRKHREREDPTRIFQTKAKEQRKVRFGLPNHSERLTDPWIGKAQNETLILELRKENGKNFYQKGPTAPHCRHRHRTRYTKRKTGRGSHAIARPHLGNNAQGNVARATRRRRARPRVNARAGEGLCGGAVTPSLLLLSQWRWDEERENNKQRAGGEAALSVDHRPLAAPPCWRWETDQSCSSQWRVAAAAPTRAEKGVRCSERKNSKGTGNQGRRRRTSPCCWWRLVRSER
jgi:hypothetical protein